MNSYIFINLKTLGNLFNKYKLTKRGKEEIIKAVQNGSKTSFGLNKQIRKLDFKEIIKNKNKHL